MGQRLELEVHTVDVQAAPLGLGLGELADILLRQKRKALGAFAIIFGTVAIATMLWPRAYHSEAKLYARLGRENVTLNPEATLNQERMASTGTPRESEVHSVAEILRNRQLVEKAVDAIGPEAVLHPHDVLPATDRRPESTPGEVSVASQSWIQWLISGGLSDRDKAILRVGRKLEVEPVLKSNVVVVAYEGATPELSQAVVARLVEAYLQEHVRLSRAHGTYEFLADQTNQIRTSLARSEQEFRELKDRMGYVSVETGRETLMRQLGQLELGLQDTQVAMAGSEALVRELQRQLTTLPETRVSKETTGVGNHGTDIMRGQLYALRVQENELSSKYTDQYPELRQIRKQLALAEESLKGEEQSRREVTKEPGRAYEDSQLALLREKPTLVALQTKAEAYRRQIDVVRQAIQTFNDRDLRAHTLQREIELQETKYRKYSENLEQARIDRTLEEQRISNISVSQPATYEPKPVRPKVTLNLLLGLALGLLGGVASALVAERWDSSGFFARIGFTAGRSGPSLDGPHGPPPLNLPEPRLPDAARPSLTSEETDRA